MTTAKKGRDGKKQTLTQRKHQEIIDAALKEFKERGYTGTSMDRISERAGASKRTVYNHFPSKEQLFKDIVNEMYQRTITDTEYVYYPDRPLKEQMYEILEAEAENLLSEELVELSRVTFSEYIRSPELAGQVFSDIQRTGSGIVSWLQEAEADGRLQMPSLPIAVRQLVAMIKSYFFWPRLFGDSRKISKKDRQEFIESTVSMFLKYYSKNSE